MEIEREKMVCSRALVCDNTTCPHHEPHLKEYKCWAGTCSVNNDEHIECVKYTIKYQRKNKLNKLECFNQVVDTKK